MSSMSPFKYFVVTCRIIDQHACKSALALKPTHRLVLLVKVVDIAIQYFHKELHGYRSVHAGICNSKGSLQTLKYPLAVAV
jgi:hypothetical protein